MDTATAPVGGNHNRAPGILALAWIECSFSLVFVAARMYTRARITRYVGLDDWFMMATLLILVAFTIIWTFYASRGGCRHIYYLSAEQQAFLIKINWMSQPFCIMAIVAGKASVAYLLLRILGNTEKIKRLFLYGLIYSILTLGGVNCILTFAQCSPPRALWTASIAPAAECWAPEVLTNFATGVGSYSAVIDLTLALFPISIIWKLQIPRKKKVALGLVLGLGMFAAVCAAIKTTKLRSESARTDFTWATVDLFVWNINEINVTIVAACIPTIFPLFVTFYKASATRYRRSRFVYPRDQLTSLELRAVPAYLNNGQDEKRNETIRRTVDWKLDYGRVPPNSLDLTYQHKPFG